MRPPAAFQYVAAGALLAWALLCVADLAQPRAWLRAASVAASPLLVGYEKTFADGTRRGDGAAVLRVPGLWAGSAVRGRLYLAAKGGPRRLRIFANATEVADREIGDAIEPVEFLATASALGEIEIRVHGGRREETVYRVLAVAIQQAGPRRLPFVRMGHYLAFGLLLALLASRVFPARIALSCTALVLGAAALAVVVSRVYTLHYLGLVNAVLAGTLALTLLGDLLTYVSGMPRFAAWPVVMICAVHLLAVADLEFGSIDAGWHTHNLMAFADGGHLVESQAPGISRAPYPPAFYAAIAPFRTHEYEADVRLVRLTMALLEGAAPVLVFLLGKALGLSPRGAGAAALMAACMPEGVLVLGKGVASNILGQFATLLAVLFFSRPSFGWAARTAAVSLLFLSHAPAAVLGSLLLLLWWALDARTGTLDRRILAGRLAVLAVASITAWLVYYRETGLEFGDLNRPSVEARFFQPHAYRIGKILQDLLLKFGALPLVVATLGFRHLRTFPTLRPLVHAWLMVAGAFALVAILSPFPLRFEYFSVPAISLLCGVAATVLGDRGERWGFAAAAFAFAIQVLEGVFWRLGRFEIISVIMESPRWPFPFRF